jgi:hypothetical protein
MPGFRFKPGEWGGLAFAVLLIGWRILGRPPGSLWRDWILLLGAYGLFTALASRSRAWPQVTVTLMAFLLGIYVHGQILYTLSILGFLP